MGEGKSVVAEPSAGSARLLALAEAVLVAAIWSSSFVGVKYTLVYAGPLTVAGLRYFLAFVLLCPWLWRDRKALSELPRSLWGRFAVMGISQYSVGNGALFWALRFIPATAGSLVLSLVPVPVLLLGILRLGEWPRPAQVVGLGAAIGGSVLFFMPELGPGAPLALAVLAVALLGFAVFPVLGREVARDRLAGNVALTGVPLGIGGGLVLVAALATEGMPRLPPSGWGVIVGLSAVNTALGYLLFNHALRQLTAVEANVIVNLSPLGTALLAWATLGERLTAIQVGAMVAVVAGVTLVQWKRG
ncbi:MAG: EamA family transporter [Candidatus Acetothermia bacterium]|nr:EamA family transporter [Candidatus Acetothermia bacterium]